MNWKRVLLRASGFGAGWGIVWLLGAIAFAWWSARPPREKPWDAHALIVGGKNQLSAQVRGEVFNVEPKCSFKNTTLHDYRLPELGTLMLVSPENGALERVEGATWQQGTLIP